MISFFRKQQKSSPLPRRRTMPAGEGVGPRVVQPGRVFQRNQTLTGSVSSRVASVVEDGMLRSPRVEAGHLRRHRFNISTGLVVLLAFSGGLTLLLSQFTARAAVRVNSPMAMEIDPVYNKLVADYLSRHPLQRFRFLTNTAAMVMELQKQAPEIARIINIESGGYGRSNYALEFRRPVASWRINGRQNYVDRNGVAFKKNYFAPPAVDVVDRSGITPSEPGQAVASGRFLTFIGRIVAEFADRGLVVQQLALPPGTTRQVEATLRTLPYPIKLSVDRLAAEQAEDAVRAVEWMKKKSQVPAYLDLRIAGRAFYR